MKWLTQIYLKLTNSIEMFYLNSTLNFEIPPVFIFQLEVYYKVERLLTGLAVQQNGTTIKATFFYMIGTKEDGYNI